LTDAYLPLNSTSAHQTTDLRLVLGTAQLNMNYGIANRIGYPCLKTSEAVVETALAGGIRVFDTAQAYGGSEKVMGTVFRRHRIENQVKVCSKIGPEIDLRSYSLLDQTVERSIERLGIPALHCLLLHKESLVNRLDEQTVCNLSSLTDSGRVRRIGISLYSPENASKALETDIISAVQIPSNLLDRRFEAAGLFHRAKALGKAIYVRSVFLQGLLLMKSEEIPPMMEFVKPIITEIEKIARDNGLKREVLLLGYVRHAYPHAQIIIGAETPLQVRDDLRHWDAEFPNGLKTMLQERFREVEERILNPNLWPITEKKICTK